MEAKIGPQVVANVWSKLIPNFAADSAGALAAHSGVQVAWSKVAEALKARGRPYAIRLFDGDVHGLQWNWRERDRLEIAWFRDHMTK